MTTTTPEEQESQAIDIPHYVDIVRRRHLHFLISLLVGWMIVWGASWILPVRYKSGTLILVEQPTMPKDYVRPNVNEDLQDRLQSITQQILSRTRLLLIIDQLKLYNGGRRPVAPGEKVDRMRKDIDIELVRDAHDDQITAFNIYYSARDPHVAQKVTGELTNLFINANLEVRQQESEDTTKFLESQLNQARASLSDQEAKVREFEGEHVGELPEQQASNLQILSGMQSELVNEQDALNTAQQQRVYLQTLINQYRTGQGTPKGTSAASIRLPVIDQELDKMKAQLADLSSRYTDRYPDVQNLKEQIAKTEKVRTDLIADLKKKGNAGAQAGSGDADAAEETLDPIQNSSLVQLQSQMQANHAEVVNREHAVASLKGKIDEYQGRLNQEPVRQQQLADLTRGYDQSKANYDELLKKENESQMATSMERLQEGERFTVLDPPSLPVRPDFPNRLKFCGIGLLIGLALGVVVAGGCEYMDDRLHSEDEIEKLLPTAVILDLPEVLSLSDQRRLRMRTFIGWAMAAFVFGAILVGSAFSYLHS
jgi:polysaccharide biosynthesis transport protein